MEPQTTHPGGAPMGDDADRFAAARLRMLKTQLAGRGIANKRVLDAMGAVRRELFVPGDRQEQAYADGAMAIGHGQTISQPYMVALMTEALQLSGTERVLEVGTGSGYQAAVLAELAGHVYTVERIRELSDSARRLLCGELGYGNVTFLVGDGTLGWPDEAPFDAIMVTAGAPHRPDTLIRQLGPQGRAVVPVGGQHWQSLTRYRRGLDGRVSEEALCDCVFVKLIGDRGWD